MSLTCKNFASDLVAFLDGELPAGRAEQVRTHVAACATCATEVASLGTTWGALDALDFDAPARDGWLDRIEAEIRPRRAAIPWRYLAAAAAVFLAVGLAVGQAVFGSAEGPIAVNPQGPAQPSPRVTEPAQPHASPSGSHASPSGSAAPSVSPDSVAPTWPDGPRPTPEPTLAQRDPFEGLSADELEVIENLELLVYLQQQEELDVLQALDLLEDLDEDELEEAS